MEDMLSLDHSAAPYADAIHALAARDTLNLMVPGHGTSPESGAAHLANLFGVDTVKLDIPALLEGIDLGENSPLEQATKLAADAWGAKRTWFLTNGASQGNRTAAFAVRGLGERVLMQRSSHSSFTDGILLAGLIPAFISPSVDQKHGVAHGLTPEALEEAILSETEAGRAPQSVYVISPSYFGATADVAGLARVAHKHGAALVVDGAWGAHFGFHPDLPESPVKLGADLVISSTHKLAGSFTQSAMLHLGDTEFAAVLEPLAQRSYMMTSSTSPSALLLASLDLARQALMNGEETIGNAVALAGELRERLRASEHFDVLSDHFGDFADIVETDVLRVPIDVSKIGQSGHWVRDRLLSEHGVYFEMSTATVIVAVIGALASPNIDRVMAALDAVAEEALEARAKGEGASAAELEFPELPEPGTLRMLPRAAYFAESVIVPAEEAIGQVSADTLAAYPPGIPNLAPGEEITEETVAFLQAVAASPIGNVRGAADPLVKTFRVVRDPLTASNN